MSLPANTSNVEFEAVSGLSAPEAHKVEPVGPFFLAHATRTLQNRTWSEYEKIEADKAAAIAKDKVDEGDEFDDEVDSDLLEHDPKDWKSADLYAVLGLSKQRFNATPDQVDRAYRKQVLKYHPDKQGEKGGFQDGFFKIIQKAYEVMTDETKRQQFDSVDEEANVLPPSTKETYDFYEAFGPVFESEARFSTKGAAPSLGTPESEKKEVEDFYKYWNSFDSWRTFEFLDEDVPDDTANRDHKRYIEKKNNNARRKRKTEDNKRLAELVRRARLEDPRIQAWKQAEKEAKERKKWEREAGARKAAEEKKQKEEAEAKAKAEAAANQQDNKKKKEAAKKAKKMNKRAIRSAVKDADYFGDSADSVKIDADVETLIAAFEAEKLAEVAEAVQAAEDVKAILLKEAESVDGLYYFK